MPITVPTVKNAMPVATILSWSNANNRRRHGGLFLGALAWWLAMETSSFAERSARSAGDDGMPQCNHCSSDRECLYLAEHRSISLRHEPV